MRCINAVNPASPPFSHERELFRRPDRAADPDRVVVRALTPGMHVFERLGKIELLERVVHDDGETRARQPDEIARSQPGDFVDQVGIERGVVPPVGGNGTEFSRH